MSIVANPSRQKKSIDEDSFIAATPARQRESAQAEQPAKLPRRNVTLAFDGAIYERVVRPPPGWA